MEGDLGGPGLSQLSPPTERTRRGVQIPLPEGMDFVREVVTNHVVSGGVWGRAVPSAPSAGWGCSLINCPSPSNLTSDSSGPVLRLCPHLGTLFPDSTPSAY